MTAQMNELRRQLEELREVKRSQEIALKIQSEELRVKDMKLREMVEDLKQSREARRMLCHSMESLEMFIQEQKNLGEGPPMGSMHEFNASAMQEVSYMQALPPRAAAVAPGLSSIRAAVSESISRDDTTSPVEVSYAPLPSTSYAPLPSTDANNISTVPISLSQLMHDDSHRSSQQYTTSTRGEQASTIVPLVVPSAPRSNIGGPRPLGPHLKALAAIDTLLDEA